MERATGRMERLTASADPIGRTRDRAGRAGRFAVGASLAGGEIARVGASIRGLTGAPVEAAAQVARSRGRLATLSMSEAGIDEVERIGRELSRKYAGIGTSGFVGAAYDVRSAMSALSEVDVAKVTGISAELGRAADATTEEMTSAVSGAYGVFKGPLFRDLSDIEFVEKFSAQLSQAVEMFRTTGGAMEQGIKTMGAGLDIAVIDEATGKLRPIASLLDDMERVFGEELEDREAAQIKEAFGRDEAVRVIEGLWGSGEELRAAAGELEAATMADVRRRARARDENLGGAMDRMRQRWTSFTELLGQRLEPTLMRLEPHLDRAIGWLEFAVEHAPGWTTRIMAVVGAIGLIAAPLANLVIAFGAVMWATRQLQLRMLQFGTAMRSAGSGGLPGGGLPGGKGGGVRGLGRKLTEGVKGLPAKVKGAATAALSIGSTLLDSDLSGGEKAEAVSGDAGAIGGALAGGALGAAIGTAVLPGVGTVVGGLLGSIVADSGGSRSDAAGRTGRRLRSVNRSGRPHRALDHPAAARRGRRGFRPAHAPRGRAAEQVERERGAARRAVMKISEMHRPTREWVEAMQERCRSADWRMQWQPRCASACPPVSSSGGSTSSFGTSFRSIVGSCAERSPTYSDSLPSMDTTGPDWSCPSRLFSPAALLRVERGRNMG